MLLSSEELCALFITVTKWTTSLTKKFIQRQGRLEVAHPNPGPISSIIAVGTCELWLHELAIPLGQRCLKYSKVDLALCLQTSSSRVEKVNAFSSGNQQIPSILHEKVGSCRKTLSVSSHILSFDCCRTVTLNEVHFINGILFEGRVAVRSCCSLQASSGVLASLRRSSM